MASNQPMVLHGYFRSSAAWRVRIALNLKGLTVKQVSHHLQKSEQLAPDYLKLNPQGLVPVVELADGSVLTQSLAIIEWLEEIHPTPAFLPSDPVQRAKARAFAMAMAIDIHPIQNLKILNRLRALGVAEPAVQGWAAEANNDGLTACEQLIGDTSRPFCFGDTPGLADICLIPQMASARRFKLDVSRFPRLLAREAACLSLPAFASAAPNKQPDAE